MICRELQRLYHFMTKSNLYFGLESYFAMSSMTFDQHTPMKKNLRCCKIFSVVIVWSILIPKIWFHMWCIEAAIYETSAYELAVIIIHNYLRTVSYSSFINDKDVKINPFVLTNWCTHIWSDCFGTAAVYWCRFGIKSRCICPLNPCTNTINPLPALVHSCSI